MDSAPTDGFTYFGKVSYFVEPGQRSVKPRILYKSSKHEGMTFVFCHSSTNVRQDKSEILTYRCKTCKESRSISVRKDHFVNRSPDDVLHEQQCVEQRRKESEKEKGQDAFVPPTTSNAATELWNGYGTVPPSVLAGKDVHVRTIPPAASSPEEPSSVAPKHQRLESRNRHQIRVIRLDCGHLLQTILNLPCTGTPHGPNYVTDYVITLHKWGYEHAVTVADASLSDPLLLLRHDLKRLGEASHPIASTGGKFRLPERIEAILSANSYGEDVCPLKLTFEVWLHALPPAFESRDFDIMACSDGIFMLAKSANDPENNRSLVFFMFAIFDPRTDGAEPLYVFDPKSSFCCIAKWSAELPCGRRSYVRYQFIAVSTWTDRKTLAKHGQRDAFNIILLFDEDFPFVRNTRMKVDIFPQKYSFNTLKAAVSSMTDEDWQVAESQRADQDSVVTRIMRKAEAVEIAALAEANRPRGPSSTITRRSKGTSELLMTEAFRGFPTMEDKFSDIAEISSVTTSALCRMETPQPLKRLTREDFDGFTNVAKVMHFAFARMLFSKEVEAELREEMQGLSEHQLHMVGQLVDTSLRSQDFSFFNAGTVHELIKEAFVDLYREKIKLVRSGIGNCPTPQYSLTRTTRRFLKQHADPQINTSGISEDSDHDSSVRSTK